MKRERPILYSILMVQAKLEGRKTQTRRILKQEWLRCLTVEDDYDQIISLCPYGKPGDILWAREAHALVYDRSDQFSHYAYKADGDPLHEGLKWRPSIHMPKDAARIYDEIVSIRVERLQDITEDDCFQEGIDAENEDYCAAEHYVLGGSPIDPCPPARFAYAALWNRINGPGSWDLNPWVWVIETKTLSTTGRPEELKRPIALTAI
jgi:hypothetical protein